MSKPRPLRLASGLAALVLHVACASPPATAPVSAAPHADLPPLGDIHDCLLASRRPASEGLTSEMVVPERYNACMRSKGWRTGSAASRASG